MILNTTYNNNGEKNKWFIYNSNKDLDHENWLIGSKFAKKIILKICNKIHH